MAKKIAVVTGASKGIGLATVIAFANAGYEVVLNYAHDDKAAHAATASISSAGGAVHAVKADVFTPTGVKKLFQAIHKRFGTIDVLVNNAGYAGEPPFESLTYDNVVESLSGNFISAVLCTQAAIPIMNKGSSILFNSSIYGMNYGSNPGLAIYSAGKAAVANFTQSMAEMLAPNIRCNAVAPGVTKTSAWNGAKPEYIAMRLGQTLQKEWVGPSEIADTFVFLANTPHVNGQTIIVDAGWMKKFPEKNSEKK